MAEQDRIYLEKAVQSLEGAASEYRNGRYNNTANRCYYACFQAAVYALEQSGFQPTGALATWSHEGLQGTFVAELISRRKRYPAELRDVLSRTYLLRISADYRRDLVSEAQGARALRRTRLFVETIQQEGQRS